eukprot:scaffold9484_cov124-Isochrysis_galbana.AAC.9
MGRLGCPRCWPTQHWRARADCALAACRGQRICLAANPDAYLAARVGASRPVDPKRLWGDHRLLQNLGDPLGVVLRLHQAEPAELRAGARDGVASDVARVDRHAAVVERGLLEQVRKGRIGHVGQNGVLLHSQAKLTGGILVGEVGQLARLGHRQPAGWHVHPHAREALLRLRVDAQELAACVGHRRLWLRRVESGTSSVRCHLLLHLRAEGGQPPLLDQPHQPRLLPVVARALVAKDAEDGLGKVHHILDGRWHPHVHLQGVGDALDGHVAAQDDVEAHRAGGPVHRRLQPDVVDVRVREVVAAARHGDVELARQVAPDRVAAGLGHRVERDEVVERVAVRAGVHHLEVVDACQRVAHHVPHIVQRRLEGGLVARVHPVVHGWSVLERDAAQLDVLPGGDVDDAEVRAVRLHTLGIKAHLIRCDDAIGHAEAEHEAARRALVAVQHAAILEACVHVGLLDLLPSE